MGEIGGFMKIHRVNGPKRPVPQRLHDFEEYQLPLAEPELGPGRVLDLGCGVGHSFHLLAPSRVAAS